MRTRAQTTQRAGTSRFSNACTTSRRLAAVNAAPSASQWTQQCCLTLCSCAVAPPANAPTRASKRGRRYGGPPFLCCTDSSKLWALARFVLRAGRSFRMHAQTWAKARLISVSPRWTPRTCGAFKNRDSSRCVSSHSAELVVFRERAVCQTSGDANHVCVRTWRTYLYVILFMPRRRCDCFACKKARKTRRACRDLLQNFQSALYTICCGSELQP